MSLCVCVQRDCGVGVSSAPEETFETSRWSLKRGFHKSTDSMRGFRHTHTHTRVVTVRKFSHWLIDI